MSLINENELHAMRHSLAHIMATATMKLWPEAKLGVGPVVENGFYYDIDIPGVTISEDDFKKIEKAMRGIIAQKQPFVHSTKQIDEAIEWAKLAGQPYKEELLNDLKRAGTTVAKDLSAEEMGTLAEGDSQINEVGFYTNGDFTDLCRGPHVEDTGKVGAFKLMRVAGAYWRGNEKNPQMQRLYGLAFATQEEMDAHLHMLEEAKKRDHRKLGKELDLFTFSPLVGSGLPLFTPRGTTLREKLNGLSQQLRQDQGFHRVHIPHITKTDLYKTSGHWDKFGDELFLVTSQESTDSFAMKPMNCPHHTQIFASKPRSYREMPQKYMETTIIYRDEKTGELNGIERVRAATQDDSHVFCTPEQVGDVVSMEISVTQELYRSLEMPIKWIRLSFRDDGPGYLGDEALWERAQNDIRMLAEANGLEFVEVPGEAAFYGPKIDFMAADALGRETQVATVQLDFVQPERFSLEYTDQNGEAKRPVMIHFAALGSLERFMSVYIEHTAGHFPFWVAPEQVRVLNINDAVLDYVDEIKAVLQETVLMKPLKYNEIRFTVDDRSESLGKKIREAAKQKVPVMLIVGDRDKENKTVSIRTKDGESTIQLSELKEYLEALKSRS